MNKRNNLTLFLQKQQGDKIELIDPEEKYWEEHGVYEITNSSRHGIPVGTMILSRLVDTFFSRISLTMPPAPKSHNTAYVLPWEEPLHWQSRSSGYSSS